MYFDTLCGTIQQDAQLSLGKTLTSNVSYSDLLNDTFHSQLLTDFEASTSYFEPWDFSANISIVTNTTHCLAKAAPKQNCAVQFVPVILGIVIVCNAFKIFCFLALLYLQFKPLVTLGDAMESFLVDPDPTTTGLGAYPDAVGANIDLFKHNWMREWWEKRDRDKWKTTRKRYFTAASSDRWLIVVTV